MTDITIWMWMLTAGVAVIGTLGRIIYSRIQEDIKAHAELIAAKAELTRVEFLEQKFDKDLTYSKEYHQKLLDKYELRIDKEMTSMENRIFDRIERSEANILFQLSFMMDMLKKDKKEG